MIGRRHRNISYLVLGLLLVSGVAHFVVHDYFPIQGRFGPAPNPSEIWLLRLHGAAAMATLLVLGTLLPTHVLRFWKQGRNRPAGLGLVVVMSLLIVSGYGLYYFGGATIRAWTRDAHIVIGLLALPALGFHRWRGSFPARGKKIR